MTYAVASRPRSTTGPDFDLDALMYGGGRVMGAEYFVFYNQLKRPDGSVEHTGDNLTGEGGGIESTDRCRGYEDERFVVDDNQLENFAGVGGIYLRILLSFPKFPSLLCS